jgi:hypothetical protein
MLLHLVASSWLIVVIVIVPPPTVMAAKTAVAMTTASHTGAMHPDEEHEQHNPKPIGLKKFAHGSSPSRCL